MSANALTSIKFLATRNTNLIVATTLPTIRPTAANGDTAAAGRRELALALLADALGDSRAGDQLALGFYQEFKGRVVAGLAQELPWAMTQERVLAEAHEILLEDLDYAAPRVRQGRDRLVTLDLNARLADAEKRGEDLDDF